ncbi:MAG: glycogen debranching enzyme N-terminal domain-containing protein, partial [Gammaproteobacteria bacterium]|nr:glycogen debranching enzyme N-terminal domain-containing protein [Gammaproteobacteria bacterium]
MRSPSAYRPRGGLLILGRADLGTWAEASRREWLVTNGQGGYACGTVALANTRRYHGLLIASLAPPIERRLLVAKFDASVLYDGRSHALG